jgi:hypothetical protein
MDTRAAHTKGNGRRPREAAMRAAVNEGLGKGVYQSVSARTVKQAEDEERKVRHPATSGWATSSLKV